MDQDTDSRTAAFERKRAHGDPETGHYGLATSGQSSPRKRAKRQDNAGGQNPAHSVPVGGNFSTSTVPLDDANDSRSDVPSGSDASKLGAGSPSQAEQKVGGAAPSINWNLGSRARIRTTLGGPRAANQINPQASTSLPAPTGQTQATDSSARTNTEILPRQIGRLTIGEDGRPIVALDSSIPEIPGIRSGVLSPNVKLLNPPPSTVHTSSLDVTNGFALEQKVKDGETSEDDDAVLLNLQSEQESGEITEGDLDHGKEGADNVQIETGRMEIEEPVEANNVQIETGRVEIEEPVVAGEREQRGPPGEGIFSKTKVVVKNLPFELSESELRESFVAYMPTVVSIARKNSRSLLLGTALNRGFGYVSFETEDVQQRAVSKMDGTTIKGRTISVKAAFDQPDKKLPDSYDGEDRQTHDVTIDGIQTDTTIHYSASDPSKVAAPESMHVDSVDHGLADKRQAKTLADLAPDDLKLQIGYFYVTKNPRDIDPASAVRCLVCMQEGHMAESCGTLLCTHCGLNKDHFSNQCPDIQKCHRCRERGHKQEECPYKLGRLAANELLCDLCQRKGHTEAECELLWRTSGKPWESNVAQQSIRRSCYECGSNTHLGNDCPTRKPGKPMGSSTWSLGVDKPGSSDSKRGTIIKGRAQQNSLAAVDDSDDDQANFYRPRIPQPARSGQIRIASDSLKRYQDNSWAPNNEPRRDYRTGGSRDDSYRDVRGYGSSAYGPNERRRSLSPQPRYPVQNAPRGGYDGSDDKQPPLPRGPPPARTKKGVKGPHANKKPYKPMPSAAKYAWSKH